ncbi:MAG TPA: YciI family protein [Acidimicrobiia bacterium]|nr:YciI family protein [Acidimicrobiia bacterium]
MQYLCLVYVEEAKFDAMTQAEIDVIEDESLTNDRELEEAGHLIMAQALESVKTATTVRMRNGKLSTTDGPFAETKEQLGGFVFIDANDLNEAIRIASRIPLARIGTIEVRPAMDLLGKVRERPPR